MFVDEDIEANITNIISNTRQMAVRIGLLQSKQHKSNIVLTYKLYTFH